MNTTTIVQEKIMLSRGGVASKASGKWKLALMAFLKAFLCALAVPAVVAIRLIRPWLLVRFGCTASDRLGHFAANTELYLCERDAGINTPRQRNIDLFSMSKPISNDQLATMWKRLLHIWPDWLLYPLIRVNRMIPGWELHEVGTNTQHDRDVHNLLDRFPPHLAFTPEEESRGAAALREMGIAPGTPFVCLIVRDSAYLAHQIPGANFGYHDFRDCGIRNFVLAAEELAGRGYVVVRMGARVREPMKSSHPGIIDYATNGMRTDFLDIYLGAKCAFCISVGTGFDAVPLIFRRPIAYVNMVPLGYLFTFRAEFLGITKHHWSEAENRELALAEIFSCGAGFSLHTADYESRGIKLIENTPEEIRDLVVEMVDRLNGTWRPHPDDDALQRRFWEIFPAEAVDNHLGSPLHGEIRARFGAQFLRNRRDWLQ